MSTCHMFIGTGGTHYVRRAGRWYPIDWAAVQRSEDEWQRIVDAFHSSAPQQNKEEPGTP